MAINVGNIDALVLAAGSSVLTGLSGQQITFLKVTATNTDTVPVSLTLNRLPSGGSASTTNLLYDAQPIGAGETVILPLSGKGLVNQQSLYALASVDSVIVLSIDYAYSP